MDRQKGFTLVEMIIAITVLGITMALAYAALHVVNRTTSTVSAVQTDVEALRTTYHLLRQHLSQSVNNELPDAQLQGREDELIFFAPVPMRALGGGRLYRFYIHQKHDQESSDQLLLTYSPADGQGVQNEQTQVLAEFNGTVRFTYLDNYSTLSEESWQDTWTGSSLPGLVKLQLVSESNEFWPAQVIPLYYADI